MVCLLPVYDKISLKVMSATYKFLLPHFSQVYPNGPNFWFFWKPIESSVIWKYSCRPCFNSPCRKTNFMTLFLNFNDKFSEKSQNLKNQSPKLIQIEFFLQSNILVITQNKNIRIYNNVNCLHSYQEKVIFSSFFLQGDVLEDHFKAK